MTSDRRESQDSSPGTRRSAGRQAAVPQSRAERLGILGSMLAGLAGVWTQGWITGTLVHAGWGDSLGYPALRWNPRGDRVSAHLLDSSELPSAWPRLDEFEGAEYRRVLIPFFVNEHDWVIGQVYADRVG